MNKLLLPLLLLLAPCGCRNPAAALAQGIPFTLRPANTGPDLFLTQEVVFHLPLGRTERVLTTVENGPGGMAIVASTPLGQTLFTLKVKDGEVVLDARVPLPGEFSPRILPVLIQLAEWPLAEVQRGLGPGLAFTEAGSLRTLTRDGKVLLTLRRAGSTLHLQAPPMGLRVDITTLQD